MNPDETQKLIIDESAAARQLRAGFPWLRFEKDLEREFRREQVRARLPQVRSNLFLATAIVFAFGMLNTLVLGTAIHSSMYWLQFAMVLPPIGVLLALTYHRAAYRVYQRYAPFVVAFIGLAVVLVESRAAQAGVQILFVGVLLCSVYVYYLVGLLFYEALRANALIWCTYLMVAIFSALPEAGVLYNTLVLLIANIVGATAAYSFEMETRTHFLEQRMLAETAARDGLTGLYNRRRFDEHLVTVWQMAQREGVTLALLLVDIDFFKRFNDRHGHQAGDECLKAVAAALVRSARRPLDFTARYGGEEFALILYDPSRQYLQEIANRIHSNVAGLGIPHGDSGVAPAVTVSIGVAYVAPTLERSTAGFVQLADEGLYEAKAEGRNRSVFSEAAYAELETGSFRRRAED
ncbi:MAG: diguanylate cyclase [Pseudomonadota bacterium]